MGILISVFLPLALVVIMFSLGLGLVLDDFKRVFVQPKAFSIGALSQLVALPVVAYAIAIVFRLPPDWAVGLMILSFCPGGFTSNMLTKLARGDLALSISLTGIITLVSIITVPLLLAFMIDHLMGVDAPPVDLTSLAGTLFLLTAVPVAVGIALRHFAPGFTDMIERPVDRLSVVLFIVIVIGALAANWSLFVDNLPLLGPALITLNIVLLAAGIALGRVFSLDRKQATAIALETGIQNATLGITVGTLIVEQTATLTPFSLPAGVYGIIMYVIALPFVFWRRSMASD